MSLLCFKQRDISILYDRTKDTSKTKRNKQIKQENHKLTIYFCWFLYFAMYNVLQKNVWMIFLNVCVQEIF